MSAKYKFPNRIGGVGWTVVLVSFASSVYYAVVQVAAAGTDDAPSTLSQAQTFLILHLALSVAALGAGIGLIARKNWAWWTALFLMGGSFVASGLELLAGSTAVLQDNVTAVHQPATIASMFISALLVWLLFTAQPTVLDLESEIKEVRSAADEHTMAVLEATQRMSSRATEDWGVDVDNPELLESLVWMAQARAGSSSSTGVGEASSREVEERLEKLPSVLGAASMAIAVADATGTITLWNAACESLLGFPASEMLGQPLPLGTPTGDTEASSLLALVAEGGALVGIESDQPHKDGSVVPVSLSLSVLPDTKRGIAGYVMAMTDLSGRRDAMSQELERHPSEAMGADLAAKIAEVELADTTHGKHAQRVMAMTTLIANHLGLDKNAAMELGRAALLHDVGKVGVEPEIWEKTGRLTDEEYEAVKRHVLAGREMLTSTNSPELQAAAEIAYGHHERWDGQGYLGMSGEEIPLGARIVAVADAFDALTHDRPYRKAQPPSQALEEIGSAAGTQFDPAVVEALLALAEAGHLDTINAD